MDYQLEKFIKEASDEDFYKRFRTFQGKRKDFKYGVYAQGKYERVYQARLTKEEPPLTQREARRRYKIAMAKVQVKWAKDEEVRNERAVSDCTYTEDCLRCMLLKRGTILISDIILCSCKVGLQFNTVYSESDLSESIVSIPTLSDGGEYITTLVISTTLSAVEETNAIGVNFSPSKLIKNRKIDSERKETRTEFSNHKCKITLPELHEVSQINLNVTSSNVEDKKVIIYAPPGFGKTTFQHKMMKRGTVLLDTDDVPDVNKTSLVNMLKRSSVLTNRLDLVKVSPELPIIMFCPENEQVLSERNETFDLNEDDIKYWKQCHDDIPMSENLAKCLIRNSYLEDWFTLPGKNLIDLDSGGFANEFVSIATKWYK